MEANTKTLTEITLEQRHQQWDRWSQILASLAIIAFLPLQLPQILKNYQLISSGNPDLIANLAIIPVLGYCSGIIANLLLMGFLTQNKELWGALVQGVGFCTSGIVLTQLFSVGFVSIWLYAPLMVAIALGLSFNLSAFIWFDRNPLFQRIWHIWHNSLSLAGLAVLPVILFLQANTSLLPHLPLWPGESLSVLLLGGAVLTLTHQQVETFSQHWGGNDSEGSSFRRILGWGDRLAEQLNAFWNGASGWTANLLFMFGPTAQLILNLVHPENMAGIAMGTQALSILGNLLLLSRSATLLIWGVDRIWSVAGFWDISMQGAVFLTIMLNGLLNPLWFGVYGMVMVSHLSFVYFMARRSALSEVTLAQTARFLFLGQKPAVVISGR